jgi:hypothetical protein
MDVSQASLTVISYPPKEATVNARSTSAEHTPEAVVVHDDHARVDHLTLTQHDTVELLRHAPDPTSRLRELVDLGTRGWLAMGDHAQLRTVEEQLDQLARRSADVARDLEVALERKTHDLETQLTTLFQDDTSPVRKTLLGFARHLTSQLDVNRTDGAVATIVDTLAAAAAEIHRDHTRQLMGAVSHQLDLARPDSPLGSLNQRLDQLTGQVRDLATAATANHARAEEAERGTAKGRRFEDTCLAALTQLVPGGGVNDTSTIDGADGTKKGDATVEWADPRVGTLRLAVEAKTQRLSLRRLHAEAAEATSNRAAAGCLWLVDDPAKLPDDSPLLVLPDQRLAAVAIGDHDPGHIALKLALHYLQLRALEDALVCQEDDDLAHVVDDIRRRTATARSYLDRFQHVHGCLTKIGRLSDQADQHLRALAHDLGVELTGIADLIEAPDQQAS